MKGGTARFGSMSEPESIRDLLGILDSSFATKYYSILNKSSTISSKLFGLNDFAK